MSLKHTPACLLLFLVFALSQAALAEIKHLTPIIPASNIIIPQSRSYSFAPEHIKAVTITHVEALVDIVEASATTTIEISLSNDTNARQEAELVFPVPDGAVVRSFAYDGPGGEITAKVLPKEEAQKIYEQLVAKIKDPALVEFAGYNLIKSSVFPIDAHARQKVRLTYESLLAIDGSRLDYYLPRSESVEYNVAWDITVNIKAKRPISTVYSSSHEIEKDRKEPAVVSLKLAPSARTNPGPFRLSYLVEQDGVSASMFAYPDSKSDGGYFLLLAGLPAEALKAKDVPAIRREITLVIDHSGSMHGDKLAQVKEAAQQIIAGLKDGESFNIVIYNDNVERFSDAPVTQNKENAETARKYIDAIKSNGGTNLYEALRSSLEQKPSADALGLVLFLTDGLPTVGNTSEVAIRELVTKSNPYNRRVFTFGVGVDLNAPLLQKMAEDSRARAEFVLPNENVEVKVGRVFKALTGPVLASPTIRTIGTDGTPAAGRVTEMLPSKLPDMFDGDQIVLLGRYIGTAPVVFSLTGNYLGKERTFEFTFDFKNATSKNGFVPRLWASRKIAELIDIIRQMGADAHTSKDDPKVKELVSEIVKLSTEYGILTEYTAFLAKEGTDLHDADMVMREAGSNISVRGVATRSGMGAVNQSYNMSSQKSQSTMNYSNSFYDQNMQRVSVTTVQQVNDRAYYRRGNRWVDSRLVSDEKTPPTKTIEYGSPEFFELLKKLETSNQQGSVALGGEILLLVDGERVLVK
jgi:Ca-activated chloride channel homolog